ncbi:hypothetical protein Esti_004544 [Eimeria stiedai]
MGTGKNPTESELLAEKLLQGWTMLGENCPHCSRVPLMRRRDGIDWCVACNSFVSSKAPDQQQQQLQQQQQKLRQRGGQQQREEEEADETDSAKTASCSGDAAGEFRIGGAFGLEAPEAEKLAACSAALKREGAALAEALQQQQQQQQPDSPGSAATGGIIAFPKPSVDLERWRNQILGAASGAHTPQQQQQQRQHEDALLQQTKALILQKINK